jgi:hypothetical protein
MQFLASSRVRTAVVASNDQLSAVEMMLRPGSIFDLEATYRDLELAWQGKVSPYLIIEKHPVALVLMALAVLVVLLILRRLFVSPTGRKPTRGREAPADTKPATPTAADKAGANDNGKAGAGMGGTA